MKKLLFLFAAFIVMCLASVITSCQDKKRTPKELFPDSILVDSIFSDSTFMTEEDDDDAPMPVAADELFDDFIFNFTKNSRLQLSRIDFPLIQYKGERVDTIEKNEWEMESFFTEQDFYILLLDNDRQMENVKDTAINHAIVEKIYLESGYVTQYIFNRTDGKWMMTSINDTTYRGTPNESFLNFYNRFSTDTLFQESSISNPVAFSGPDPDNDFSDMEGTLMPEQWRNFAPDLPREMIYNVVYGLPARSTLEKLFVVRGISNGSEVELTFKNRDGKWKLTKLTM